jgi:hypothetical protein
MIVRFTITVLALGIVCQADTLRLRNGATVTGSFLGGSADEVRFMVDDQVQRYPRADVAAVIFTSIAAPSATPSIAPAPRIDTGPDIVGVPFLRGASGLIPLEREIGMMSRSGGGAYGMGGTVYRIQGTYSPVRVRQSDRIVFVVRMPAGADPRRFQLYRLEPRMNYRQTQPTMGGTPPSLPLTINKVGDSVYEITSPRGLYPGEYAISPFNSNESYCFGVDY